VVISKTHNKRCSRRRTSGQEKWRPLKRGLIAVSRQIWRRCIRIALLGAVEFANLAEMDLGETNLDLLVLFVVEFAIAQLAFGRKVRALSQRSGECREIAPRISYVESD